MKKILVVLLMILLIFSLKSQNLVDTFPQLKNVVMEEFTGIHCQYCPQGHAIAQGILNSNPGRVVVINVHQGGYAAPNGIDPDYRTSFGDALYSQSGATGYPCGTVNRHVFAGMSMTAGGTGMGRGAFIAASNQILSQNTNVNIGVSSQYDSNTRNLTVTVELFYTGNSSTSTNYINVALTQDSIVGVQQNGSAWVTNYVHNHMLRHLITGQWGDVVNTTTQGTLITRTYNYTIPTSYTNIPCDVSKCDIAVFVNESHQETINGVVVKADGGSNQNIGNIIPPTSDFVSANSSPHTFSTVINSALSGTESYEFILTTNEPSGWSSIFTINGNTFSDTGIVSLTSGIPSNLYIDVTPDATPFIASYILTMKSVSNPTLPIKYINTYVISNVSDLIVNGSGGAGWTGGTGAVDFENYYLSGLAYANNTQYTSTSMPIMMKGITQNAFTGINNIYANIGWTFPALQDDETIALETFLNNGGNLFIAGQDMGWDIMSGDPNANGNTTTQNFYTNYLHASFINDGGATNTPLTPNANDSVFKNVSSSPITVGPYDAGMMYPDQITPTSGSAPIFYYGSGTTKCAGIRYYNGTYKVVYLGVGLEMLSNSNTRNEIIKQSHDWFYGLFTDTKNILSNSVIKVYPNPATDNIYIDIKSDYFQVKMFDLSGNIVYNANSENEINITKLSSGLYILTINDGDNTYRQKVSIIK